tara:strand:- start:4195 stop:5124 length:930 start_codon:yes stop_codon:yes gene_type:complete
MTELYSELLLAEFKKKLEVECVFEGLSVFCTGSFARGEAHRNSDIDLFVISNSPHANPKTQKYKVFAKLIDVLSELGLPPFSDDCKYLNIICSNDIASELGGPNDDHKNYFTARMLLLLESHCIIGKPIYDEVVKSVVGSYYSDFDSYKEDFKPIFLLNDIKRYWRTLLLNYEHRRAISESSGKIKNFKLKYSRLLTCFATIAYISSMTTPVSVDDVVALVCLTPKQRLLSVKDRMPKTASLVTEVLELYDEFLKLMESDKECLINTFSDEVTYSSLFSRAKIFGDKVYELLKCIDSESESEVLRYLVV